MTDTMTPPAAGFTYFGLRGFTREDLVLTSASLAPGAVESGTIDLAPGWRLAHIATDVEARLRLYDTTGHRTSDISRPIGTDPTLTADHGLLFEFVTTATLLSASLSPLVDGYCPSGIAVPYSLTNLSGSTTAVEVTLAWLRTE